MTMKKAQCDIIIPVLRRADLTANCVESIRARTHSEYNLIFIDNASDPETKALLERLRSSMANVEVVRNHENLGWVKAINQGIRLSVSPFVCVMNNDTVVRTDGWLERLISVAESADDIGLVNPNFDVKEPRSIDGSRSIEIDFCRGYCILIKAAVVEKIGLFDESYGLGYYDDDDYSLRAIRSGFRCVMVPGVHVEHLRDTTFSALFKEDVRRSLHEKNKELFYAKWGRRLKVVVIVSRDGASEDLARILFSLARRQHIVSVWNLASPLRAGHINIRETHFPRILPAGAFSLLFGLNRRKRREKRYDAVFVDTDKFNLFASRIGFPLYRFDAAKDRARIEAIADSLARS